MKDPKEYLDKWSGYNSFPSKELEAIVKEAQEEAKREGYNEAIDDAINELDDSILEWEDWYDFSKGVKTIDNPELERIKDLKRE